MSNVYTLKDIKNRGHRLDSAYEQELEKKLRTAIYFNSEITDYNEKLQAENLEYSEREKEFQRTYADIGNKISQLNASSTKVRSQLISERKSHSESQRELEAKYTAEIQSLKSEIKTLKRKETLAQKASSADKVQILSLEAKIRGLEGKLEDIDLERTYHDSLKLELERANEDLNSKNHEIECMEKGMKATHEITSREIDNLRKERLNSMEENSRLREIISKKDNEIADLSNPPPHLRLWTIHCKSYQAGSVMI
jgi:chromosome segregation ATPase